MFSFFKKVFLHKARQHTERSVSGEQRKPGIFLQLQTAPARLAYQGEAGEEGRGEEGREEDGGHTHTQAHKETDGGMEQ